WTEYLPEGAARRPSVGRVSEVGKPSVSYTFPMPPRVPSPGWALALAGLFLAAFAVLALTGPGRIDIIDGQTRYEVARSLWEHGDVQVRDPEVWFPILPGPDGKIYTDYRLPHSALGVPALALADGVGPPSEARRHFYFLMLSAVA